MKRIVKNVSLFVIVVLSLLFACTLNTYALSQETSYVNINNTQNLKIGNLSLTNISFKDYSSTSTKAFGLTGLVKNNSNNEVNYTSTINYYDSNYNLIARCRNSGTMISGTSDFNQMSNLNILGSHDIKEIYYYSLSISVSDANLSENDSMNLKPSQNGEYSSYDFVIDKYNINIIVNENNTFDITETITTYFNVPKHGINRKIPLKNNIVRLDGTTSNNRAQITNISVNNKYTKSIENGNYKLTIGSPDKTLTGEQKYVIKYTYNLGKDNIKNYDELYYNLIGGEWNTVIGNITYTITMPKEFDSSKLGFSSGDFGSTNNKNIKYNVSGNTIAGSYNGILNPNEFLTVRCELPEGYFVGAKLDINVINYILIFIPIAFLLISILLWYKFGRDEPVVETVEFYPPRGLNSLEVGFLYKGEVNNRDVTSLLIYLANQGYIKISEQENKTLFFKNKQFKITKLKEYDGTNINEKIFLNGLFKKNPSAISLFDKDNDKEMDSVNEVTSIDLYDNFYTTMNEILSNTNNKINKEKVFEKSSSNKAIFIVLMIIATYCLITIPPMIGYSDLASMLFALLFPGIGFTVLFALLFCVAKTINVNGRTIFSSILLKIIGIIFGLCFGVLPWSFIVLPVLKQDLIYMVGYGVGLACVFGMLICLKYLPKRTSYGNEMFGKIKGFKNFLKTAEKDKLEAMVMKDPTYFYNILPYTYVLGVSDKWIKKFETISLQAPSWCDSFDTFDMATFETFMNSTMSSAQSAMSSIPSDSPDSSSGGGSSGGGSGGGGGDSW